jgi:acetyl esterase/lipase
MTYYAPANESSLAMPLRKVPVMTVIYQLRRCSPLCRRFQRAVPIVVAFTWATAVIPAGAEQLPISDPPNTISLQQAIPSAPPEQWERLYGEFRRIRNVTAPTLTPFLPDPSKATGAAVIVAPGGGFFELEIDHEGYMAAKWLAEHGIAAFVLKYRLQESPRDEKAFVAWRDQKMKPLISPPAGSVGNILKVNFSTPPEALEDGKAAIQLVRARAREWHIDPARVGFSGFSAGAILTLSMAMIEDKALRPDFVAPIYGPMGELAVPAYAPPMFTAIALDDFLIPASDGQHLGLISSWRTAGRPVEAHLYASGGHGFGMNGRKRALTMWIDEFYAWMYDSGFLKPPG